MKKSTAVFLSRAVAVLMAIFCGGFFVSVQGQDITSLPSKGDWSSGTISGDVSVAVNGNVILPGTITIPSGASLTITMADEKSDGTAWGDNHVVLVVHKDFSGTSLFKVENGGTLNITGLNYKNYFGIRGTPSYNFKVVKDGDYLSSLDHTQNSAGNAIDYKDLSTGAINTCGTLNLNNVRIYDIYSSGKCGAIYVPVSGYKHGKTTVKNSWIHRCSSVIGAALMVEAQIKYDDSGNVTGGSDNTAESCAVLFENVTIRDNYVKGVDGTAGVIRTYGNCVGNITLKNTKITGNKSGNNGCAIFWNGHGRNDTKMSFDGCTITYNHSEGDGGAMSMEGTFEFVNNTTTLAYNKADKNGGAITIKAYGSKTNQIASNLVMTFSKYFYAHHNEAKVNGGAIGLSLDDDSTLPSGSKIGVTFDGVRLLNNTADNHGGAFYYYSEVPASQGIGLEINVCGDTDVSNNNAAGNGGGLYLQTKSGTTAASVTFDAGTFKKNAGYNGGAAYIGDMDVLCSENADGLIFEADTARYDGGAIYLVNGSLSMKNSTVKGNVAEGASSGYGGGIYVTGGNVSLENGTIISNTAAGQAGGIYVLNGDFTMTGGEISSNVAAVSGGGLVVKGSASVAAVSDGLIRSNKATAEDGGGVYVWESTVKVSGGSIISNECKDDGGGVFLYGGSFTMTGGEISSNVASSVGAGVYVEKGDVTIDDGSLDSNKAVTNGGGVYVTGGTCKISGGFFTLNQCKGHGGGLYTYDSVVEIEGGEFVGNQAAWIDEGDDALESDGRNGGAIYCKTSTADTEGEYSLTLKGGTFRENKADRAGGVYVSKANVLFDKQTGDTEVLMENNLATNTGAAVAIYDGSSLTINGGQFINNVSYNTAGAIHITDGGTAYLNGGLFEGNSSENNGGVLNMTSGTCNIVGGKFINNTSATLGGVIYLKTSTCTLDGGEISYNTAPKGAAIYLNDAQMTVSDGTITNNTALLGGGVFLAAGADMVFGNGFIANNRAKVSLDGAQGTVDFTTTNVGPSSICGVGGGVFLGAGTSDNPTTLTFNATGEFGLYNNSADVAADDIYARGSYTSITLPDISEMTLTGYESKTSELYWVEDYMTGDTGYHSAGTNVNTSESYSPIRYRDAIAAQTPVYKVVSTEPLTKFVCLSLGHEIIYITLVRSGLLKGENTILNIYRLEDNGTADPADDSWVHYSSVLFSGPEGAVTESDAAGLSVSKRFSVYSGKWKVVETPWNWSYDTTTAIERTITGASSDDDKIFVFDSAKSSTLPAEHYDESVVVNDFGTLTTKTQ